MKQVRSYLGLVLTKWNGLYAGPIAAFIGLLMLFFGTQWGIPDDVTTLLNRMTISIAVLLFPVAQYLVWSDEVKAKEAAEASNILPDLRGKVTGIRSDPNFPFGQQLINDKYASEWHALFTIDLTNHRNVTTNIHRIEVDGSQLVPPLSFEDVTFKPVVADYANMKGFAVQARVLAYNCRQVDIHKLIDLTPVRVTVFDGLDRPHNIEIHPGQSLGFPWYRGPESDEPEVSVEQGSRPAR